MPAMSALTQFTDGVLANGAAMANLATNLDNLTQITTGKTAASGVSTKPILVLQQTAPVSIPNNATTLISWSSPAVIDTDTMWAVGTPTVITVKTAGWWDVTLQVSMASAAASFRSIFLFVNGTTYPTNCAAEKDESMGSANQIHMQCKLYARFAVNDTIRAAHFQSSGGAINTVTARGGVWMSAVWDGP